MGNAEGQLAPHTAKRATLRNTKAAMLKEIMKEHDTSKTGKLSRKEVREMAQKILGKVAKGLGGLEYEETELIMRCGGSNVKAEITAEELPQALAIISIIKEHNKELDRLFERYDADGSGDLPADQLKPLLQEVSEGAPVADADVDYVLKQCEPRGVADPIKKTQLKAAIACWYVHDRDIDVVAGHNEIYADEDEAKAKEEKAARKTPSVQEPKKKAVSSTKKAPSAKKAGRAATPRHVAADAPKASVAKALAKNGAGSREEIMSKEDTGKKDESGKAVEKPAAKASSYKAENVQAAWDNHFGAFGSQDVAQIMLDYTEESVLRAFDHRTGQLDSCKGLAEIQKFFEGLFATLKDTSDLAAPTIDVTEDPKQVYLIWSCGASGIVSATDSFIFDDDNTISRQNIAFTSKADTAALDNAWQDAQMTLSAPKDGSETQTIIADGAKVAIEASEAVPESTGLLADEPADVPPAPVESFLSRLLPFGACRACCRNEGSGQDYKDAEMPTSRDI